MTATTMEIASPQAARNDGTKTFDKNKLYDFLTL